MGRTLQREKKKQASLGPAAAGVQHGKGKKTGQGPAHPANHTAQVSAAFATKSWDEVIAALERMRRAGEEPKLGTVQRWVRLADLCGDERVAAAVLACVLRCIPGSGGPLTSLTKPNKKSKVAAGPVRRHPPWSPALSPQQLAWNSTDAASPAAPPPPLVDYSASLTLVAQDGTTQPSKRPPNWSELQIWRPEPGVIRFSDAAPKVVRVDVPFVPGAFVLTGMLSPDECRQLVAATEACGYRWDVDYTFNPSNPDSAATADPQQPPNPPSKDPPQQPLNAPIEADPQQLPNAPSSSAPHQPPNAAIDAAPQQPQCVLPTDSQPPQQPTMAHHSPPQPTATHHSPPEPTIALQPQHHSHPQIQPPQQPTMSVPDAHHTAEGDAGSGGQNAARMAEQGMDGACGEAGGGASGGAGALGNGVGEGVGRTAVLGASAGGSGKASEREAGKGGSGSSAVQHPLLSAARTTAGGDRAAGCVWLADDGLLGTIFRRAAPHLPAKCGGKALAGINARFRFYRYDAGNVYRPHVDGAWPGSGLKDGKLCHDAFGDRWSHYTFLVYLNDDFEGGSTTFFTPAADDRMALDARGVKPRAGNVLCFPHGDTVASLVHEGSAVTRGAKYVIRTDVLYFT